MIERVQVLIEIREERSNDVAAVRGVNKRAFGQEQGKEYRRCIADERTRFAFGR